MRYVAIFNMSIYALTLSVLLNVIYIAVNAFITFNMEYFSVMYSAVAAIYLVAAILILKSEFIKKQQELIKIAEAKEIIKKEEQSKQEEEKEEKENKETGKEEKGKEKKEKKDEQNGEEPEGSNA